MCRPLPLLLLPLVAAVLLAPRPAQTEAADPVKAEPVNKKAKGTNYAFLVGCAGYDKHELQPIKDDVTVNDVVEFRKALLATGFADEHVVMLHDKQAEKGGAGNRYLPEHDKIVKELDLFLDGLTKDDTVVVVLSGHGVHFKGDATGYLCPVDAKVSTKAKLIPMDGEGGIYTQLERCKAGRKLLVANACRNDPAAGASLAGDKIELVDDYPETVPAGIAAIYSCDVGQKSYFDPDRKRSLFFLHLTDAWTGGATLEEVLEATRVKTKVDASKTYGEKQFPVVKRRYDGEWTLAKIQASDYDLTGGHRFVHFGPDGQLSVLVMVNNYTPEQYEVRAVNPLADAKAMIFKAESNLLDAVFNPTGTKVVTAIHTPAVWDVRTGEKLFTLKHGPLVKHASFSPDGSKLITASTDKTAAIWDARTGNELLTLKHGGEVRYAAFSPDGTRAVTASKDKTASIWDAKTGEKLQTFKHSDWVGPAAFSPDGSKLVTASWDHTAAVWDI